MKKLLFAVMVGIATALLAGCSSGPKPLEVTVEMSEFAFSPNTLELQVGQEVTIHLENTGALDHEFMIGRNTMMMDGMASGYEHNMFEGDTEPMVMGENDHANGEDDHAEGEDDHGMDMDHGFMVQVNAGDHEKTITFTVTEDMVGEWEIGCFLDSGAHYTAGMTGKMIVSP